MLKIPKNPSRMLKYDLKEDLLAETKVRPPAACADRIGELTDDSVEFFGVVGDGGQWRDYHGRYYFLEDRLEMETQPVSRFAVYFADSNQVVFSDEDIESYDPKHFSFILTKVGAEKVKSYQASSSMNGGLYQKSFVVKLNGEDMYRGKFWTRVSSMSEKGIVMLDVLSVDADSRTLWFSLGYPESSREGDPQRFSEDQKALEHQEIFDHFLKAKKLVGFSYTPSL